MKFDDINNLELNKSMVLSTTYKGIPYSYYLYETTKGMYEVYLVKYHLEGFPERVLKYSMESILGYYPERLIDGNKIYYDNTDRIIKDFIIYLTSESINPTVNGVDYIDTFIDLASLHHKHFSKVYKNGECLFINLELFEYYLKEIENDSSC